MKMMALSHEGFSEELMMFCILNGVEDTRAASEIRKVASCWSTSRLCSKSFRRLSFYDKIVSSCDGKVMISAMHHTRNVIQGGICSKQLNSVSS